MLCRYSGRLKASTKDNKRCLAYGSAIFRKDVEKPDFVAETTMPPRDARVVVCGGGVMGAAVAYNLAKLGWGSETVLVEQNRYVYLYQNNNCVSCCVVYFLIGMTSSVLFLMIFERL